jgi:hypothetical protein
VVEYLAFHTLIIEIIATGYRTVIHGKVRRVVVADYLVVGQRFQHQELAFVGGARQRLGVYLETFVFETVRFVVSLSWLFV